MLLPNVGLTSWRKERFECWQTSAAGLSVIVVRRGGGRFSIDSVTSMT